MKNFVEPTALGQHQEKGFPEIGSTRIAISQLELIGQPTGVSGYAVSRLDPSGSHQPQVPHTTYSTHLGGFGYLGGLERPVPPELMFPDFLARRRAECKAPLSDDRSFSLSNVHQVANQQ